MTAHTSTSLFCDSPTREPVDGIRTVCGLEFGPADMTRADLRHIARQYGWTSSGANSDWCPTHAHARLPKETTA